MVPPSSDWRYPQVWDCASPSNGRLPQDRDSLPHTLRTGCFPGTRLTSPTYPHPPQAPSSQPSRPGGGRRSSAAPPTHASLLAGAWLASPRILGSGRFVCFSFWEQTSRAFPNNHKPAPSGDLAKGSSAGAAWLSQTGEQAWGLQPCSPGSSQAWARQGSKPGW